MLAQISQVSTLELIESYQAKIQAQVRRRVNPPQPLDVFMQLLHNYTDTGFEGRLFQNLVKHHEIATQLQKTKPQNHVMLIANLEPYLARQKIQEFTQDNFFALLVAYFYYYEKLEGIDLDQYPFFKSQILGAVQRYKWHREEIDKDTLVLSLRKELTLIEARYNRAFDSKHYASSSNASVSDSQKVMRELLAMLDYLDHKEATFNKPIDTEHSLHAMREVIMARTYAYGLLRKFAPLIVLGNYEPVVDTLIAKLQGKDDAKEALIIAKEALITLKEYATIMTVEAWKTVIAEFLKRSRRIDKDIWIDFENLLIMAPVEVWTIIIDRLFSSNHGYNKESVRAAWDFEEQLITTIPKEKYAVVLTELIAKLGNGVADDIDEGWCDVVCLDFITISLKRLIEVGNWLDLYQFAVNIPKEKQEVIITKLFTRLEDSKGNRDIFASILFVLALLADSLPVTKHPLVITKILTNLDNSDEKIGALACISLVKLAVNIPKEMYEMVMSKLLTKLDNGDEKVRAVTYMSLQKLAVNIPKEMYETVITKLLSKLDDNDERIRVFAFIALYKFNPHLSLEKLSILEEFLEKLGDSNEAARCQVCANLDELTEFIPIEIHDQVITKLVSKLKDSNKQEHGLICLILAKLAIHSSSANSKMIIDALLDKLDDRSREVRTNASLALGKLSNLITMEEQEAVISKLFTKLIDKDEFVRTNAYSIPARLAIRLSAEKQDDLIANLLVKLKQVDFKFEQAYEQAYKQVLSYIFKTMSLEGKINAHIKLDNMRGKWPIDNFPYLYSLIHELKMNIESESMLMKAFKQQGYEQSQDIRRLIYSF